METKSIRVQKSVNAEILGREISSSIPGLFSTNKDGLTVMHFNVSSSNTSVTVVVPETVSTQTVIDIIDRHDKASADTMKDQENADADAVKTAITVLKNKANSGTLTPSEIQRIISIMAKRIL